MTDRLPGNADRNLEVNPYKTYRKWQKKHVDNEIAGIGTISHDLQWDGIQKLPDGIQKWPYVRKFWSSLLDDNRREAIKVVISMFGIFATLFAGLSLFLTYSVNKENIRVTKEQFDERQIADRFAKAAILLSEKADSAAHITAIFTLETVVDASSDKHWMIMEVLSNYVLSKSSLPKVDKDEKDSDCKKNPTPITNNVQVALTVIGRRKEKLDKYNDYIDLSKRNLNGAILTNAKLKRVYLKDSCLQNASLQGANLTEAVLTDANLSKARLEGAKLGGAYLKGADFSGAHLKGADFTNADLTGVKKLPESFSKATLNGAILLNVKLGKGMISKTQLNWTGKDRLLLCNTKLPDEFNNIDKDRDCEMVTKTLFRKSSIVSDLYKTTQEFQSKEEAKKFVDDERKK